MTAEELRELDVRVHRLAMGRDATFSPDCQEWLDVLARDSSTVMCGAFVPHYSTDIGAAWLVVDWWRSPRKPGGYGELMIRCEGRPESGLWVVELGIVVTAHARTLPEAICRAALKALETKPV